MGPVRELFRMFSDFLQPVDVAHDLEVETPIVVSRGLARSGSFRRTFWRGATGGEGPRVGASPVCRHLPLGDLTDLLGCFVVRPQEVGRSLQLHFRAGLRLLPSSLAVSRWRSARNSSAGVERPDSQPSPVFFFALRDYAVDGAAFGWSIVVGSLSRLRNDHNCAEREGAILLAETGDANLRAPSASEPDSASRRLPVNPPFQIILHNNCYRNQIQRAAELAASTKSRA